MEELRAGESKCTSLGICRKIMIPDFADCISPTTATFIFDLRRGRFFRARTVLCAHHRVCYSSCLLEVPATRRTEERRTSACLRLPRGQDSQRERETRLHPIAEASSPVRLGPACDPSYGTHRTEPLCLSMLPTWGRSKAFVPFWLGAAVPTHGYCSVSPYRQAQAAH
jgi:hypothetical protein